MPRALFCSALLAGCCLAATANADEFSWDLSGGASQSAVSGFDIDGSALAATYYFDSVDDSQGPYSLAAFFNPASRISLALSHTRQKSDLDLVQSDLTTKTDDYTIGGRYWLSASKWYAGGEYTKSHIDSPFEAAVFLRDDSKAYRVFAGKYLGPRTTLEFGVRRSVHESEEVVDLCLPSAVCVVGGTLDIRSTHTTDDVGVSFEHVRRFRSLTYSLFGSVTETSGHNTLETSPPLPFAVNGRGGITPYWTWSAGAEVFPTEKLGFRVAYTRADYDGAHADSYDVAATWFFKRNIGIQLAWSKSQYHSDFSTAPSVDSINLRFIGRL